MSVIGLDRVVIEVNRKVRSRTCRVCERDQVRNFEEINVNYPTHKGMNHYGTEESTSLAHASASFVPDAEESSSVGWATPRRESNKGGEHCISS